MKKRLIKFIDFNEESISSKEVSLSPSLSTSSKKIKKTSSQCSLDKKMKAFQKSNKGRKNPWQPKEDEKVLELINVYGLSWAQIANELGNRTGKQVRDRYLNYLRPDIKIEDFTPQENEVLLSLYYQYGHRWSKIASFLEGRTECQVKNWYYTHIKKKLATDPNNHLKPLPTNKKLPYSHKSEEKKEFDMNQEILYKREDNYMSRESSETFSEYPPEMTYPYTNDATEFISYDNSNNIIYAGPTLRNNNSCVVNNLSMTENLQSNMYKAPFEEVSLAGVDQVGPSFNEEFLKQVLVTPSTTLTEEQIHGQALPNFGSAFENKEKIQRYEELVRMKNALEFFYTKTLQEMSAFEREAAIASKLGTHQ